MAKTITIIDRRLNPADRQLTGRQRFIERKKAEVKKAVADAIKKRSVKDKYDDVLVNIENTQEPFFVFDGSGETHLVSPGNRWFKKGDKFRKAPPQDGQGGPGNGAGGGGDGDSEDSFSFILTKKEFEDILFEDLGLPDLMRKANAEVEVLSRQRAGYKPTGNPADLDIRKTSQNALARRIALKRPSMVVLEDLAEELDLLEKEEHPNLVRIAEIKLFLEEAAVRAKIVPWIDPVDTKYRQRIDVTQPRERVVMFAIMDVSGSMGEREKDIAKRYFLLLLTLLARTYGEDKVEVVYIRHHTEAEECSEEDFFYKQETGGTLVSSAMKMMADIIATRYPADEWNIYGAQASDGDNMHHDNPVVQEIIETKLLPVCQYFTYVDIRGTWGGTSDLWPIYKAIDVGNKNFAARQIADQKDIWPVFQDLFKKVKK